MAKTGKPKSSKSDRRTSDIGCLAPFLLDGVIMPHVVSPEVTGDEVTTPPINRNLFGLPHGSTLRFALPRLLESIAQHITQLQG